MMQEIEQTRAEKIAVYLRLTKRELAEMLVNANEVLRARQPQVSVIPEPGYDSTTLTLSPLPTIWDTRSLTTG